MKKNKLFFGIILICLSLFMFGCSKDEKPKVVSIVVTDNAFDSQSLHNAIAKIVVENAYDNYTFSTSTGSSTMNWQAIISGDIDLDIESWTDNVATYNDDVANGDIVHVGILVENSDQGLYVPKYVIEGDPDRNIEPIAPDLKTVEDLKKYPHIFPNPENKEKGLLYGSIPGWMADTFLHKKYEAYGLDEFYDYVRLGSEATLFASLAAAYNLGEAWVGYCYEPTWVAGKYDIVLLDDAPYDKDLFLEGKTAYPSQKLSIVSSKQFAEKAPDLLEFFQKYKTTKELVSKALAHMIDTGESHDEAAKWLLKNNDYLLDEWLPKEKAESVRNFLK